VGDPISFATATGVVAEDCSLAQSSPFSGISPCRMCRPGDPGDGADFKVASLTSKMLALERLIFQL